MVIGGYPLRSVTNPARWRGQARLRWALMASG
jgi:hypothetical protein